MIIIETKTERVEFKKDKFVGSIQLARKANDVFHGLEYSPSDGDFSTFVGNALRTVIRGKITITPEKMVSGRIY